MSDNLWAGLYTSVQVSMWVFVKDTSGKGGQKSYFETGANPEGQEQSHKDNVHSSATGSKRTTKAKEVQLSLSLAQHHLPALDLI